MELRDSDKEWQKNAPVLASMSRSNPFSVPDGYFDTLSEQLKARVLIESELYKTQKDFHIPENYFNELSHRIQDRISMENALGKEKKQDFLIPDRNPETLHTPASSRTGRKKSYWIGYAAAACIAMIAGSVIYFNSSQYTINRKLSDIPDQEIINYLQMHTTISDNQYIIDHLNTEELQQVSNDISTQELELYINNTTL